MSISVGLSRWSNLQPDALSAIRAFSLERGEREDYTRVDEAFWAGLEHAVPVSSTPFGFQIPYNQPETDAYVWALGDFVDEEMRLDPWKKRFQRTPMSFLVMPFGFNLPEGYGFADIPTGDGGEMLIASAPTYFMKRWEGARPDARGAAYKAVAAQAWEAFRTRRVEDNPDERAALATMAMQYAMYELLWQAWTQRLPVAMGW